MFTLVWVCAVMCMGFIIVGVILDFVFRRDMFIGYLAFVFYALALLSCVLGIILAIALSLTKWVGA